MEVKISTKNIKMGGIPSVSLPAGLTCRSDCECFEKCYARKIENLRSSVKKAYQHNLDVLNTEPDTYWRDVEASIKMSRFFRFHVSGDIPDDDYLLHMLEICRRNSYCNVLCFTKKFDIVNEVIHSVSEIPENLHLILSAWKNLEMVNPLHLPEAHVRFKDGTTTAREDAKQCGGNCTDCALTDSGCWTIGLGEQVVFNEH